MFELKIVRKKTNRHVKYYVEKKTIENNRHVVSTFIDTLDWDYAVRLIIQNSIQ